MLAIEPVMRVYAFVLNNLVSSSSCQAWALTTVGIGSFMEKVLAPIPTSPVSTFSNSASIMLFVRHSIVVNCALAIVFGISIIILIVRLYNKVKPLSTSVVVARSTTSANSSHFVGSVLYLPALIPLPDFLAKAIEYPTALFNLATAFCTHSWLSRPISFLDQCADRPAVSFLFDIIVGFFLQVVVQPYRHAPPDGHPSHEQAVQHLGEDAITDGSHDRLDAAQSAVILSISDGSTASDSSQHSVNSDFTDNDESASTDEAGSTVDAKNSEHDPAPESYGEKMILEEVNVDDATTVDTPPPASLQIHVTTDEAQIITQPVQDNDQPSEEPENDSVPEATSDDLGAIAPACVDAEKHEVGTPDALPAIEAPADINFPISEASNLTPEEPSLAQMPKLSHPFEGNGYKWSDIQKGECADVYSVRRRGGDAVIVKRFRKEYFEKGQQEALNLKYLKELREDSEDSEIPIVTLRAVLASNGCLDIIIAPLGEGDIRSFRNRNRRFCQAEMSIDDLQFIGYQVTKALHFLHTKHAIHCDVRPTHIVILDTVDENAPDEAKERGLNAVRRLYSPPEIILTGFDSLERTPGPHNHQSGDVFFRAPEVLLGVEWSYARDGWSFGMTLVDLYAPNLKYKSYPFPVPSNVENIPPDVIAYEHLQFLVHKLLMTPLPSRMVKQAAQLHPDWFDGDQLKCTLSPRRLDYDSLETYMSGRCINMLKQFQLHSFIRNLLVLDPNGRMSMATALNHPFFERS